MRRSSPPRRAVTLGLSALLFAVPAVLAGQVTVDDLMHLRSIYDVRISPDGRTVAYVVATPDTQTAAHEAALFVVPAAGGRPRRLAADTRIFNRPLPAAWLRWRPDGRALSFIGFVNGVPQVLEVSMAGGPAHAVTAVPGGVTRFEWSPDGASIAFPVPDPPADSVARAMRERAYVIHVDRDVRRPRLHVLDLATRRTRVLTPPNVTVLDFNWAPDGRSLVYGGSDMVGFEAPYGSTVYAVPAAGGHPRTVVARTGTNRMPRVSPDGKWIAFVSSGGKPGMVNALDLYLVPADVTSPPIGLTTAEQLWVSDFAWAPDGRSIYYVADEQTSGTGVHMFEQPVDRIWVDSRRVDVVTPGPVDEFSLSLSADGKRLAAKQVENRTMGDVFVTDLPGGAPRKLTDVNPQLRTMSLGDLRPVHWSSFDGQEIWGLLLTPPGYDPGHPIPMLTYVHGGPIGGFTYGIFPQFAHISGQVSPYPVEAMASAGMSVLFPMPRGGSGYGVAGFRAIMHRWGEVDYRDIMAGVDAMVARGIADSTRLGIMGASYGGFMTNWIVGHTDRFRAASTAAGTSDLAAMYYTSEGGDFIAEYFGLPWTNGAELTAHSPITFVQNVHTPLLIQHGESDPRVPIAQAWEFYRALRALHRTVEFDIYPRGGHVNYEPPLERQYMRRNLEWFERWLGVGGRGASGAAPAH